MQLKSYKMGAAPLTHVTVGFGKEARSCINGFHPYSCVLRIVSHALHGALLLGACCCMLHACCTLHVCCLLHERRLARLNTRGSPEVSDARQLA